MASKEELEAMGISNQRNINNNIENNNFNNDIKINGISLALKVIGVISIIAGLITGFILFEDEFFIGLAILIGSVITGTLILGVGEIIQLLEDIKNK